MPSDLVPAVPQRLLPSRGGGVVPGLVLPRVLVAQLPVQFDHDSVLVVNPVPASPSSVGSGEPHLPARRRQPVRPLHVPAVIELEHRMVAARRRRDHLMQVRPPPQPGPAAHRLAQPVLVNEIPGKRPGHPTADIIKRLGRLGKVKHSLLYFCPRRIHTPPCKFRQTPGTVNAHVGNRDDPALPGDGHVNRVGCFVGQPVKFSRRLVTEQRAAACRQHRRPQPRPAAQRPGESCVDPGMDLAPPSAAHPELDHV